MIKKWFLIPSILMSLALGACSSSDDKATAAPQFPEKSALTIAAGERVQIEFDAPQEWRMTSDKSWLRFMMGEPQEEVPIAYGPAGKNTLQVYMKEIGHNFTTEMASLSLTMGNTSQVIFEVSRPAKVREMQFILRKKYNGTLDPVETVELPYKALYDIGVQANFDWKITSSPAWLYELGKIVGKAGEEVTKKTLERIRIITDSIPYPKSGEIRISDRVSGESFTIPFTYAGMDATAAEFQPATLTRAGMTFSHDGFYGDFSAGGSVITTDKFKDIAVTTRSMEHRIVAVSYNEQTKAVAEVAEADSWISRVSSPTKKDGEYRISTKSNNTTDVDRVLYLYFLPPAYATTAYNYAADFDATGHFSSEVGIKVTHQAVPPTEGFTLTNSLAPTTPMLPPTKVEDPALIARYGTTNIYERTFTAKEWDANGLLNFVVHGVSSFGDEFETYSKWLTSLDGISRTETAYRLQSRKKYAQLQASEGVIKFYKTVDKTEIHGVLIIKK